MQSKTDQLLSFKGEWKEETGLSCIVVSILAVSKLSPRPEDAELPGEKMKESVWHQKGHLIIIQARSLTFHSLSHRKSCPLNY